MNDKNFYKQLKSFLLHLRLNYQILILSGPYLLGILFSEHLSVLQFIQFLNVHILLFGGVTAYNSFFDKDTGPIGGLKNPPKMGTWMLVASWMLQVIGLIIGILSGPYFIGIYLFSILVFWMYSSPLVRLKGKPVGSLIAIGIGTVICACLLGYYANGIMNLPSVEVLIASIGSMFLIISMYPLSQAYQVLEDKKRGDITFSVRYGKRGIKKIFSLLFPIGIVFISYALLSINILYSIISIFGGILAGILIWIVIKRITMTIEDYKIVMRIKYVGGLLFSLTALLFILLEQ